MKQLKQLGAYINFTVAVVLIGGLVFTIGFGLCLYMMRQEVTAGVDQKVTRDIEYVQNYVDGQLQRVEDVAFTALCNSFHSTTEYNAKGIQQVCIDTSIPLPSEEEIFRFLEQIINTNTHICGIAIGFEPELHAPQGQYGFAAYVTNVSGRNERLRLGAIHDYRQKPWYKLSTASDAPAWSAPFRETSRHKVVTCFTYPIHDMQRNVVGALALDIDTEPIRDKCKEATPYPNAIVAIADRNFNFVSHPDTSYLLKNVKDIKEYSHYEADPEMKAKMLNHESGHYTITRGDGEEAIFYFSGVPRTGWTISIESPTDDIYGHVARMRTITTYIALASILFMVLCLLYLLRRIQRVARAKASIENELGVASEIQMSMIPKIYPAFPTRSEIDIFGFLKPAKSVGGDLFDYFVHEDKLYFCIGDVSGKGVPASLFMMSSVSLFRNVARTNDDPAAITASLNESLARNNTLMMFCTMFIGILDLSNGHLQYCNAGHNYPILCRKTDGGDFNVQYVQPERNMPLAVFKGAEFVPGEYRLNPGDAIFLYTDGVNEAEDIHHVQFGENAALDILSREMKSHHTSDTVVNTIFSHIVKHTDGAEQSDDITMLQIAYKGKETTAKKDTEG